MSEKLTHQENGNNLSAEVYGEKTADSTEKLELDKKHHESPERIKTIHEEVEKQSKPKESIKISEAEDAPRHSEIFINRELKDISFSRTMARTRKHLSYPNKLFSKFIHNQGVDRASHVIGNTVTRPTSTLVAGITACIASIGLLYTVKKYGYEYNYLFIIMVFVGGYLLGLGIELLIYLLMKNKKTL